MEKLWKGNLSIIKKHQESVLINKNVFKTLKSSVVKFCPEKSKMNDALLKYVNLLFLSYLNSLVIYMAKTGILQSTVIDIYEVSQWLNAQFVGKNVIISRDYYTKLNLAVINTISEIAKQMNKVCNVDGHIDIAKWERMLNFARGEMLVRIRLIELTGTNPTLKAQIRTEIRKYLKCEFTKNNNKKT